MGKKWGKQVNKVTTIIILLLSLMITNSIKTVESQTEGEIDEQVFVFRFWTLLNSSTTPFAWNYPESLTPSNFVVMNQVGASLYQKDANNSGPNHDFIPQLAADLPEISEDGLTYTVTLKEGLKFSNGNPLTSDDIVFSYNLYLSPSISEQIYDRLSYVLESNSSITKIDDHTIQFQYLEDSIFNFEVLSSYPIIESKQEYIDQFNNCNSGITIDCIFDFDGEDVFTSAGPFKIESHDLENHEIQLVKNPYYHDKEVWADRLIFQGNRGGNFQIGFNSTEVAEDRVADLIAISFNPSLLDEWEQPHPYTMFKVPHARIFQMTLNFLHPIFGTGEAIPLGPQAESDNNAIQARHVRTAFTHLMDRDYMSDVIWGRAGISTSSLIPRTAVGYNGSQEVHEFSLDLAKSHLELAGFDYSTINDSNGDGDYDDENDTRFFNFTNMVFLDQWRPDRVEFMNYTESQFAKVGIGFNLIPDNLSRHLRYQRDGKLIPIYDNGGFDTLSWVVQYGQPFISANSYTSLGLCDSTDASWACYNIGGYKNAKVDSLTYLFDETGNYTIRTALLPQIQA
ncbi:MAG: ABC transporter substrate-binding protein, partial [Candidatus Kariarchaeaceae archaeon]